jgi:hypothetical protein
MYFFFPLVFIFNNAKSNKAPITGTLLVPIGTGTITTTLPAYNGYIYNVSVTAVNAIGYGPNSTLNFVVGLPPQYPTCFSLHFFLFFFFFLTLFIYAPSAVDYGIVSISDDVASFSIQWDIDYADTGMFSPFSFLYPSYPFLGADMFYIDISTDNATWSNYGLINTLVVANAYPCPLIYH